MKSFAISLATLMSLAGAAAYAADEQQQKPTDVMKNDPKAAARYWESRNVEGASLVPAPAANPSQKGEEKYWSSRDPRSSEPWNTKVAQGPTEEQYQQEYTGEAPPPADQSQPQGAQPAAADDDGFGHRLKGVVFEVGGGIGGFIDNRISSETSAQGQWTARAVVGSRRHFGGELAYNGSAQGLNTFGVGGSPTIVGSGGEANFRYNLLTGMFQPYAVGGIGYMHYGVGGANTVTSDISTTGDVMTFPLGAGLAWRMNHIVLDTRLSFHPSTTSDLVRGANLSTWDLQAKAGFEF